MGQAVSATKSTNSTTLKWVARIFVGLVAFAVVVLLWRIFAGKVEQRFTSPDDKVVAEVREYNFRPATEPTEIRVQVRDRFHVMSGHTVFDGLTSGAEVKISWIDSRTLLIRCVTCNQFQTVSKEEHWGPISIQYEID